MQQWMLRATEALRPTLWLDAHDDSTHGIAGYTLRNWYDRRTPIQAAAQTIAVANRPAIVTNGLNGLTVIRYDGSDDYQDLLLNNVLSDFCLVAVTTLTGYSNAPQFGNTAASYVPAWYFDKDGAGYRTSAAGQATYNVPYSSYGSGAAIALLQRSGNQLSARINGNAHTAITCDTTTLTLNRVGARGFGAWLNYFSGDLAEVILFASALTTAQQQLVEGYLSSKCGIALPSGHPYHPDQANITGNCIVSGNGGAQEVIIREAATRLLVATATPDETTGDWSASVPPGDYDITYFAPDCQPICHGPYTVTA